MGFQFLTQKLWARCKPEMKGLQWIGGGKDCSRVERGQTGRTDRREVSARGQIEADVYRRKRNNKQMEAGRAALACLRDGVLKTTFDGQIRN